MSKAKIGDRYNVFIFNSKTAIVKEGSYHDNMWQIDVCDPVAGLIVTKLHETTHMQPLQPIDLKEDGV